MIYNDFIKWISCKLYNLSKNIIVRFIKKLNRDKKLQILLSFLSASFYSKLIYLFIHYKYTKSFRIPSIKNPKTFNEKILFLKLYERNPYAKIISDRRTLPIYLKAKGIDFNHVPKTLLFVNSIEELDINKLPKGSYFIKACHGSGMTMKINLPEDLIDKRQYERIEKTTQQWLNTSYAFIGKEYQYYCPYNERALILEEDLNQKHKNLIDIKLHFSRGGLIFSQVDYDRFTNHTRSFYDSKWNKLPFSTLYPLNKERKTKKPIFYNEILQIGSLLSEDFKYLRVDFIANENIYYLGELTMHHGGGFEPFLPEYKYDLHFGNYINL